MAIIRSPGFATNWQYFTNAVFFDANFMSLWNDPEFLALKERMAGIMQQEHAGFEAHKGESLLQRADFLQGLPIVHLLTAV